MVSRRGFLKFLGALAMGPIMRIESYIHGQRAAELDLVQTFVSGLDRSSSWRDAPSLLEWGRTYLPHYLPLPPSKLHAELERELSEMIEQRGQQLLTVAPRDSAKSTLLSTVYPLYSLCLGIESFIVIAADSTEQAEKHILGIRKELEHNERIAADYPEVFGAGPTWQDRALTLKTGQRIECVGTGKRMHGRRHGEYRPSLIIVDDPEGMDSLFSQATRDRRFAWFQGAVKYAKAPTTNIVLIGTMIHDDCTVSRTLTLPGWRGRKVWPSIISWPERMDLWDDWERFYREDEDNADAFYKAHQADMDVGAEVIWPERTPLLALMQERAQDRASFARERQNEPLAPEGARFEREWFVGEDIFWESLPGGAVPFAAVDPATGKNKKTGDYSAIVYAWWAPGNPHLYVDAHITRDGPPKTNEAVADLHSQHDFRLVAFEAIAFQEVCRTDLEARLARRGMSCPVIPATQKDNKFLRIDRLGPLLQRRRIRFRKGSAGASLLKQQLERYSLPAVDKLDGPDCLEMLVRLIGLYARHRENPSGARIAGAVLR